MSYPEDVFGPPEEGQPRVRRRSPKAKVGNTGLGLLCVVVGHAVLAMGSRSGALEGALFIIGIAQLAYVIPLLIVFSVRRESATATGVALGAGITFLLNAACFGIVCGGM